MSVVVDLLSIMAYITGYTLIALGIYGIYINSTTTGIHFIILGLVVITCQKVEEIDNNLNKYIKRS